MWPSNRGVEQFSETHTQQVFEALDVRHGMNIATKSDIGNAIVTKDGNIDSHLAADWNVWVRSQHFAAQQVERLLWSGDVSADHIAEAQRKLGQQGCEHCLQRKRHPGNQGAEQTHQVRDTDTP